MDNNQEICNCKQCQAIRSALRFSDYITNHANPPLTPQEFNMMFRDDFKKYPIAEAIVNKVGVYCHDGLIRMR